MNATYRILHLEDVPADAELVRRELKNSHMPFTQLVIDSEIEYVKALEEFSPDIILCDHSLPSFNSFEALRIIKEKKLNIPFILITAVLTEDVAMSLVREGADDYILKDRLKRLPNVIINAVEKFRFEKKHKQLIDEVYEKEALSKELLSRLSDKVLLATRVAGIGIWEFIFDQNKFLADDVLLHQYGLSAADFNNTYEELMKYIPLEDQARVRQEFQNALMKYTDLNTEYPIVWPDGSIHFIKVVAVVQRDHSGNPSRLIGTHQDVTKYKKAEDKIKESNKRFEYVTKATFDAIWDWDLVAKTIYWGEGFQTLFGYNLQEVKPDISSWTDHIHAEDLDRVVKGIHEFIDGSQTNWIDEYRYLKTDQTYAYVTDKGVVIRNDQGKGIRMVGAMQDITEKKELENLLNKANHLARMGSWEVDMIKETLYFSDITKEIHEVEPDFIPHLQVGLNFYKEGKNRDLITQKMQDAIEKGSPWDVELQIITARGNEKWIRSIGETESVNGKCVRINGSFQDIDTRKKAELSVIEAFEEKNIILESIGDAFFAVDKNWIITYWNSRAEKVLGKTKDEIVGHHLWKVFPDSIDSISYQKYHQAIERDEVIHFEDYYPPLSTWYEISAYPSHHGLSVYFKDVTERKVSDIRLKELNENLQKQARELAVSNGELEQFAYVASHDLQEPLRMVTSFLTQLEKKFGQVIDDEGKKYIEFAVDGAKRMRQIILDLLEFSRIGKTNDNREDLDLNALVKDIQILFRKEIEDKNAMIQVKELPVIHACKTPLRQVFQNLISNALKYTRKDIPAEILITAKELKDHWQFAVMDNGIGIDKEYFDRIFIIFQRLHNKDEFSGTGMGLAVTKKIIENLGGKIWVESMEGKGSAFYFNIKK